MNILKTLATTQLPNTGKRVNYVGYAGQTTGATNYTFTNQPIGDAESDRVIIVAIAINAGAARTVSSVTLAGNAMTSVANVSSLSNTALFRLEVPSGTTATIVVNGSGTSNGCFIVVYSLLGWGTLITRDSRTATGTGATLSRTINEFTDGVVIGVHNRNSTNVFTATAGFGRENVNNVFDATQRIYAGRSYPTTLNAFRTYSVTGTAATSSIALGSFTSNNQPYYVASAGLRSTTSPLVVNKPTGTQQNDVMIAFIIAGDAGITPTYPAGWTQLILDTTGANSGAVAYKIAGAAEPTTYSFTVGGTVGRNIQIVTIRNATTVVGAGAYDEANGTDLQASSITGTTGILLAWFGAEGTPTLNIAPNDMSLALSITGGPVTWTYFQSIASGTTGNKSLQINANQDWRAILVNVY